MLKKKAEKKDRNKRWRYKTTEQNKKHWFCIIRGMDDFFFFFWPHLNFNLVMHFSLNCYLCPLKSNY